NREAHVPAICEFYGVPHTASDPLTLALAHHKARAKDVFAAHGVATPAWCVAHAHAPAALPGDGPWIVKPVHEGSSMGIAESAFCRDTAAVRARVRAIASQYAQ